MRAVHQPVRSRFEPAVRAVRFERFARWQEPALARLSGRTALGSERFDVAFHERGSNRAVRRAVRTIPKHRQSPALARLSSRTGVVRKVVRPFPTPPPFRGVGWMGIGSQWDIARSDASMFRVHGSLREGPIAGNSNPNFELVAGFLYIATVLHLMHSTE